MRNTFTLKFRQVVDSSAYRVFSLSSGILFLLIVFSLCNSLYAQDKKFQVVRLKFDGGSDWYNDPSSDINLMKFLKSDLNLDVKPVYKFVDISSDEIFAYPFIFMTGHGNVSFSNNDALRLKTYLENGGFLYIDDDYGLDKALRRELKKVFTDKTLIELPFSHPIFHIKYEFSNGTPKTHEHDGKVPQTFAIYIGKRVALVYTFEANPSDGWADKSAHNDPEEKRIEALKFGANIVLFALTQ